MNLRLFLFGAEGGFEPARVLNPHGPQPCASANSATSASSIIIKRTLLKVKHSGVYSKIPEGIT